MDNKDNVDRLIRIVLIMQIVRIIRSAGIASRWPTLLGVFKIHCCMCSVCLSCVSTIRFYYRVISNSAVCATLPCVCSHRLLVLCVYLPVIGRFLL